MPPKNPPTIPPTNFPIAVPTPCNKSPPSPISHFRPGSCANAPTAARTRAISAITTPMPRTPAIAPGISPATAESASIIAESKPIPTMPSKRTLVSIPFKASTTPLKNAPIRFTAALINSGSLAAIALMTPIRKSIR